MVMIQTVVSLSFAGRHWRNKIAKKYAHVYAHARSANSRYMVKGVKSMCVLLARGARRPIRARCGIMFGTRIAQNRRRCAQLGGKQATHGGGGGEQKDNARLICIE